MVALQMPGSAARAVLLALALAAPAPGGAKWVRGRALLPAGRARVIAKFCFDFNAVCGGRECSDAEKPGVMDFNLSAGRRVRLGAGAGPGADDDGPAPVVYLALLDDEYFSFPEVSQVWGEANCTDVVRASKRALRLDWDRVRTPGGESLRVPLVERLRPRWWYVALASCSGRELELSYEVHLRNHLRGWQAELSIDAMGVVATALALALAFGLLAAAQLQSLRLWRPGRGLHPALSLLSGCALLSLGGHLCWLRHHWLELGGEAPERWQALARAQVVAAKTLMQILLMLLAQGRCVCTPTVRWAEHQELLLAMGLFGLLSLGLEVWGDSEFRSSSTEFVYDTRPGCALVAFDVVWLWNYASSSWDTFRRETRAKPRRFYRLYGPLFGVWFATLPLIAALARAVAPWVRFGVTFALTGAVHAVALGALIYSFHPSVAVDLYELKAHQAEAMNDSELDPILKGDDDVI